MCVFTKKINTIQRDFHTLTLRLTRCPTLCGTAQHFYPLSHAPHIETVSYILIGCTCQKSNHCTDTLTFILTVKNAGNAVITSCYMCECRFTNECHCLYWSKTVPDHKVRSFHYADSCGTLGKTSTKIKKSPFKKLFMAG